MEPVPSRDQKTDRSDVIQDYQEDFSPNELPFEIAFTRLTGDRNKDIARVARWLGLDAKLTKANSSQEGLQRLNTAYKRALEIAKEQKEEREGLRDGSITIFNAMMRRVFGDPPESTPPAA